MKKGFDLNAIDMNSLLGEMECPSCGKVHTCNMKKVVIGRGAVEVVPEIAGAYSHVVLVCDENTYKVCGHKVECLISGKVDGLVMFSGATLLVPNEDAICAVESKISADTDLIVGVGSGVINDLCKHVSQVHGLPYFIVATAPSMDGYASKGAAMILGGMKVTTNAAVPMAIVADTAVLKNAPKEMLAAGYGDIIGKYSCLNDWRLSAFVNGESLCEYIYNLTMDTVQAIAPMGRAIMARDERAVEQLMRALVIVGIAMAYMGNSRPASGSEHHLSHYFEIVGLLKGEPYYCHGTDVAYSTYVTAQLRKELIAREKPVFRSFDQAEWEQNIRRVYAGGDNATADGIIALQKKLGWIFEDKTDVYSAKWDEIRAVLKDSPSPEEVEEMLGSVDLPIADFEAFYSAEKRHDALYYAKDLKDRYTVLWLYYAVK